MAVEKNNRFPILQSKLSKCQKQIKNREKIWKKSTKQITEESTSLQTDHNERPG